MHEISNIFLTFEMFWRITRIEFGAHAWQMNTVHHNERSLSGSFFYILLFELIQLFKMCFIPQVVTCFAPQGHSKFHYQKNVLLNGISDFPVIGLYFIDKINWTCGYLFISIAFTNI